MRLQTKFLIAFAVFFAIASGCMIFFLMDSQRMVVQTVSKDVQNIL